MDAIKQANHCRNTLVKMLKVYSKYEGKNLNRYKNLEDIENLKPLIEDTPFNISGLFSCPYVDRKNVDTVQISQKIEELEGIIYDLDTVETDLSELIELTILIKKYSEKKKLIMNNYKNIPTYFIEDLIRKELK
jgi:uncharacterized Fe-S cluster-containing protein